MSKSRIIKAATVALIVAAIVCVYLWIVEYTGIMPRCPINWATGLDCPGCGSQRAFLAFMKGDFRNAILSNLIVLPALMYVGMLFVCWLCPESETLQRIYRRITTPRVLACIAALMVVWMIVRNMFGI